MKLSSPSNPKWRGWRRGELQIHFIHTGVGESIFAILPDSTSMLIDCGDQAAITRGPHAVPVVPGPERLACEWVARYVLRVNPNGADVDWAILTHFHGDHSGTPYWQKYRSVFGESVKAIGDCARSGFGLAAEYLHFRRGTDRGVPGYDDPITPSKGELGVVIQHIRALWEDLRRRDGLVAEPFRLGATDQFTAEHGGAEGLEIRNVCANGRLAMPDGTIRDLYAERIAREHPSVLNENAMSLGMVVRYGNFRMLLGGDFSDRFPGPDGREVFVEDYLGEAVGRCDVAKINHHGHHAMGSALAAALRSDAYIACVWDNLHCTDDTMESLLVPGAPDDEQPLFLPTVLPVRADGERPWWRFVPEQCRTGCHVVVTVPPGGERYDVSLIDARDEEMRVVGEFSKETRRK